MKIDLLFNEEKKRFFEVLEGQYRGFTSDGASVPVFFHFFLDPFDARYIEAFVKHDWEYTFGYKERKQADEELRDELIKAGMNMLKASIIYFAVRIFGNHHFHKKSPTNISEI